MGGGGGGVVRPLDPMALALYNDALTIPVLCNTTFVEFYSSKHAMVNHCTSYFLVWDITFKGCVC